MPACIRAWSAVAVLSGPSGAKGVVYFDQPSDVGVHITGNITGLTANAQQGWHIQYVNHIRVHVRWLTTSYSYFCSQYGDLTNGCNSTGTHFNPYNSTHGAPWDSVRHVGDLGNLQVDANGVATLDIWDDIISLSGDGDYSIIG